MPIGFSNMDNLTEILLHDEDFPDVFVDMAHPDDYIEN